MENKIETVNVKQINKNKGFSLMEFLIYMVLVGLAIVVVMAMYSKNSNTNNAKTMATDLQSVSSGIKSSYASDDLGYVNANNTNACNLGLLMSTLSYKKAPSCDGKIKNKFNGDFLITPAAADPSGKSVAFSIQENNVPAEVINKTISQIGTDGVLGIEVNGTCVFSAGVEGSDAGTVGSVCSTTAATGLSLDKVATALGATNNGEFSIAYGM